MPMQHMKWQNGFVYITMLSTFSWFCAFFTPIMTSKLNFYHFYMASAPFLSRHTDRDSHLWHRTEIMRKKPIHSTRFFLVHIVHCVHVNRWPFHRMSAAYATNMILFFYFSLWNSTECSLTGRVKWHISVCLSVSSVHMSVWSSETHSQMV